MIRWSALFVVAGTGMRRGRYRCYWCDFAPADYRRAAIKSRSGQLLATETTDRVVEVSTIYRQQQISTGTPAFVVHRTTPMVKGVVGGIAITIARCS